MWPMVLDMSKAECKRSLRTLELDAYSSVISTFKAQGDLTNKKAEILKELQIIFKISVDRHKGELRRAANDEKLYTIAKKLSHGECVTKEWLKQSKRIIPLLPNLVHQNSKAAYYRILADHILQKANPILKLYAEPSETSSLNKTTTDSVKTLHDAVQVPETASENENFKPLIDCNRLESKPRKKRKLCENSTSDNDDEFYEASDDLVFRLKRNSNIASNGSKIRIAEQNESLLELKQGVLADKEAIVIAENLTPQTYLNRYDNADSNCENDGDDNGSFVKTLILKYKQYQFERDKQLKYEQEQNERSERERLKAQKPDELDDIDENKSICIKQSNKPSDTCDYVNSSDCNSVIAPKTDNKCETTTVKEITQRQSPPPNTITAPVKPSTLKVSSNQIIRLHHTNPIPASSSSTGPSIVKLNNTHNISSYKPTSKFFPSTSSSTSSSSSCSSSSTSSLTIMTSTPTEVSSTATTNTPNHQLKTIVLPKQAPQKLIILPSSLTNAIPTNSTSTNSASSAMQSNSTVSSQPISKLIVYKPTQPTASNSPIAQLNGSGSSFYQSSTKNIKILSSSATCMRNKQFILNMTNPKNGM